jgi:RHS repeat-associated protein
LRLSVFASEVESQTFFLYDQGQVVLEYHKTGDDDFAGTDLAHRYHWNPAVVDQLLADEQVSSPASAGDTYWMLSDQLGSIRDVVDDYGTERIHRDWDSFGNIVSETHYNASGVEISSGTGYIEEEFAFTGRFRDDETGLQNNLNRWYDPATGRWTSEDPLGFAAGDANLNRYVGNEPTGYIDPSGLVRPFLNGTSHAGYGESQEPWYERRKKIDDTDEDFLKLVCQPPVQEPSPQEPGGPSLHEDNSEDGVDDYQRTQLRVIKGDGSQFGRGDGWVRVGLLFCGRRRGRNQSEVIKGDGSHFECGDGWVRVGLLFCGRRRGRNQSNECLMRYELVNR